MPSTSTRRAQRTAPGSLSDLARDVLSADQHERMSRRLAAMPSGAQADDLVRLWVGATLLYGDRWQVSLAEAYGRDPRNVRRYATGALPVPGALLDWLALRLQGHRMSIERALPWLLDREHS